MISITITAERRTWRGNVLKTWARQIPECWEDIPERRRRLYYSLWLRDEKHAAATILSDWLDLPRWAMRAISPGQIERLKQAIAWMQPAADCSVLPIRSFRWHGVQYHFPAPMGENITCIEYPMADEYYEAFTRDGQDSALLLLTATLVREANRDQATVLREDDARVPLHSRAEILQRANHMRNLPAEYQIAVLLFFAGLKKYVYRTYGPHLFEGYDPDEAAEDNETQDEQPVEEPSGSAAFGWWGAFQDVAEAGLFGTIKQVYQHSFHEVCMYLVRSRMKAREMEAAYRTRPTHTNQSDE